MTAGQKAASAGSELQLHFGLVGKIGAGAHGEAFDDDDNESGENNDVATIGAGGDADGHAEGRNDAIFETKNGFTDGELSHTLILTSTPLRGRTPKVWRCRRRREFHRVW